MVEAHITTKVPRYELAEEMDRFHNFRYEKFHNVKAKPSKYDKALVYQIITFRNRDLFRKGDETLEYGLKYYPHNNAAPPSYITAESIPELAEEMIKAKLSKMPYYTLDSMIKDWELVSRNDKNEAVLWRSLSDSELEHLKAALQHKPYTPKQSASPEREYSPILELLRG
jgi:hypothetical protein